MSTSYNDFKKDIKEYINRRYCKNVKILDVKPGIGTYAKLLYNYNNIDCVEIYEPYIEQFNLKTLYRNVFNENILEFDFEYYDIIIMNDILEYLSVNDSLNLLNKILPKCKEIIISVPYLSNFNYLYTDEPNKNELHIQVDLTEDVMLNRYPMLKRLWSNDKIGVYVKQNYVHNDDIDLAITVYIDDNDINEFECLYKSYIYSGNYINSDIVAFCNPSIINKLNINIINDSNVVLIPLEPLSSKDLLWKDYKFINSVYFLTTKESEILLNYKYVLSTDCDVFITKNLINFRPHLHTFGLGHYISEWDTLSRNNIENILKKLNLKYNFIHNIGSSYLYKTQHVINFKKFQMYICNYLINNEFKNDGKPGSWYKGSLTMYAGEITANQLGVDGINSNILDSYSMSNGKIGNTFYHIRACHTEQFFSKYKFRNGEYDGINVDELDIELVNNYCLFLSKKSINDIKKICNYNIDIDIDIDRKEDYLKKNSLKNDGISIVMAYNNRKEQLIRTLSSIQLTKYNLNNLQIIIVDDCSDEINKINNINSIFPLLDIILINIDKSDKKWICSCIPYNIGFNYIKYNKVIIQNPESYHVGDIISDVNNRLTDENYLTYACYSISQKEFYEHKYDDIKFINNKPKFVCSSGWYNHSEYNPKYYHFLSSITTNNLFKLNGFDENYKDGIGYDDNEFLHRIRLMNLNVQIINNPFILHQWHESIFHYNDLSSDDEINQKNKLFNINKKLYNDTLKLKQYKILNNKYFNK